MILNIILLVTWLILGLYTLIKNEPVSKITYGLTWFCLMLNLLHLLLLEVA